MKRLLWCGLLALSGLACGDETIDRDWEFQDCSEADEALIDHAIAEAVAVEPYVDEALSNRYGGDAPGYGEIVERLIEVRSEGKVLCAVAREGVELDWGGHAAGKYGEIRINVGGWAWVDAREEWTEGQAYGQLSVEEVEAQVGEMDRAAFHDLRRQAQDYLVGPSWATSLLTHEAAHLVTRMGHGEGGTESRDCDFVDSVGKLAEHGIYWHRWHDESQWLDQLYWTTHPE